MSTTGRVNPGIFCQEEPLFVREECYRGEYGRFPKAYTKPSQEWMGWRAVGYHLLVFGRSCTGGIRFDNRLGIILCLKLFVSGVRFV